MTTANTELHSVIRALATKYNNGLDADEIFRAVRKELEGNPLWEAARREYGVLSDLSISSIVNSLDAPPVIDQIRAIVRKCQCAEVEGVTVDLFTASLIIKIHDGLNDENRAKFASMDVANMIDVALKLALKFAK